MLSDQASYEEKLSKGKRMSDLQNTLNLPRRQNNFLMKCKTPPLQTDNPRRQSDIPLTRNAIRSTISRLRCLHQQITNRKRTNYPKSKLNYIPSPKKKKPYMASR